MRSNKLLTAAVLFVAFGCAGCRGGVSEKPPIHLNQNMDQQRRLDPQQEYAFFPDGRASRPPVAGTIAWTPDAMDAHRADGMVDGAFATTMPASLPLTRELVQRGRERYEIYCAPCHDVAGVGNGPVVQRGMLKPPSLHDDRLRAMPVGQLYDIIRNGVRNMPPYGAQVPVDDRWAIASYVRALQLSQAAPYELVPGAVRDANQWTRPAPPEPEPQPEAKTRRPR